MSIILLSSDVSIILLSSDVSIILLSSDVSIILLSSDVSIILLSSDVSIILLSSNVSIILLSSDVSIILLSSDVSIILLLMMYLPLGVQEGLRFVIMPLPGLFFYLFFFFFFLLDELQTVKTLNRHHERKWLIRVCIYCLLRPVCPNTYGNTVTTNVCLVLSRFCCSQKLFN